MFNLYPQATTPSQPLPIKRRPRGELYEAAISVIPGMHTYTYFYGSRGLESFVATMAKNHVKYRIISRRIRNNTVILKYEVLSHSGVYIDSYGAVVNGKVFGNEQDIIDRELAEKMNRVYDW